METLAACSLIVIPLLLAVVYKRKGRVKSMAVWGSIAVWVCCWGIDVSLALSTWRLYLAWKDYSALTANNPYYVGNQPAMPEGLIWSPLVFIVILVLPVVWFYRDRRKAGVATGAA